MKIWLMLFLSLSFSPLLFAQSKCKTPAKQSNKYPPLVYQTTDYTCGPASMLSLLRFRKIEKFDEMSLAKVLGTTVKDGTLPPDFIKGIKALGLQGQYKSGLTFEKLREFYDQGKSLIALIDDEGDHWILIVEMNKDSVITMNPWPDKCDYTTYSISKFKEMWHAKIGNQAAIIIDKAQL